MRVEVELSPVIATDEMLELAKLVDEAGADRLGISDVAMLRVSDFISFCIAVAQRFTSQGKMHTTPSNDGRQTLRIVVTIQI